MCEYHVPRQDWQSILADFCYGEEMLTRSLTPTQRDAILERDLYLCVYCGDIATCVDHVIPWSWSQCDDPYNLVASCDACNLSASNMVFNSFNEKARYIRIKQSNMKHKHIHMLKHHCCAQCKKPYFVTNKSSNILCEECYPEST